MNAGRTARERARVELTREIKDQARRHLATEGADGLSLRAVARDLGMVSSAVYRYFPSKDDLLTALIVDAYDAVGEAAERAGRGPGTPIERWTAVCHAIRDWARAHQHEYALLYGSPVPGYSAPRDTVTPASRVPLALLRVAEGAERNRTAEDLTPEFAEQLRGVLTTTGSPLAPEVLARVMVAWTQLFGMLGFELSGQLVGSADPADELFAFAVAHMTRFVGLPGA